MSLLLFTVDFIKKIPVISERKNAKSFYEIMIFLQKIQRKIKNYGRAKVSFPARLAAECKISLSVVSLTNRMAPSASAK